MFGRSKHTFWRKLEGANPSGSKVIAFHLFIMTPGGQRPKHPEGVLGKKSNMDFRIPQVKIHRIGH